MSFVELIYAGNGKRIKPSEPIVITLEGLRIRDLYSRDEEWGDDHLLSREGTLLFSFGGQETALSWATERKAGDDKLPQLKNPKKFEGHVVYVGLAGTPSKLKLDGKMAPPPKGVWDVLNFTASVIETDNEERKFFENLARSLGLIGSIAGAVPVYGAAVSAGAQLLSSIAKYVRARIDDDVELDYVGGLAARKHDQAVPDKWDPPEVRDGDYRVVRSKSLSEGLAPQVLRTNKQENLWLDFKVHPIKVPDKTAWIEIALADIEITTTEAHSSLRRKQLSIELVVGDQPKRALSKSIAGGSKRHRFQEVLGFQNRLLYAGPFKAGLQWALAVNLLPPKQTDAEKKALAEIIKNLGAAAKTGADKDQKKTIDKITGAAESIRAYVAEFDPEKTMVAKASGLLIPESADLKNTLTHKTVVKLKDTPPGQWTETDEIELISNGGTVKFRFRFRRGTGTGTK